MSDEGVTVKASMVLLTDIATMRPESKKFIIDDGPYVLIENEADGLKEGGFLMLLRVKVTERSFSWEVKHPLNLTVLATG